MVEKLYTKKGNQCSQSSREPIYNALMCRFKCRHVGYLKCLNPHRRWKPTKNYTLKYQPHHCKCIVKHCNARILIEQPVDGMISREPSRGRIELWNY
jgi:hypothetical protein